MADDLPPEVAELLDDGCDAEDENVALWDVVTAIQDDVADGVLRNQNPAYILGIVIGRLRQFREEWASASETRAERPLPDKPRLN